MTSSGVIPEIQVWDLQLRKGIRVRREVVRDQLRPLRTTYYGEVERCPGEGGETQTRHSTKYDLTEEVETQESVRVTDQSSSWFNNLTCVSLRPFPTS